MKIIKPYYYDKFRCKASRCEDSCCIGWEIDIDPDTLKKYNCEKGELGEKLKKNIENGSFILKEDERCPFLMQNGLCELICQKDEEFLCEICSEHPRYYEYYGDCCDMGLGLCCEEACRLLFESEEPLHFVFEGEGEHELIAVREELIKQTQDRSRPFEYYADFEHVISVWNELEPFDRRWSDTVQYIKENLDGILARADEFITHIGKRIYEYEHLRVYLLHRHFMKLCRGYENISAGIEIYLTTQLLWDVYTYIKNGDFTLADRIDTAKYLSKQLEYSEENTDLLFW